MHEDTPPQTFGLLKVKKTCYERFEDAWNTLEPWTTNVRTRGDSSVWAADGPAELPEAVRRCYRWRKSSVRHGMPCRAGHADAAWKFQTTVRLIRLDMNRKYEMVWIGWTGMTYDSYDHKTYTLGSCLLLHGGSGHGIVSTGLRVSHSYCCILASMSFICFTWKQTWIAANVTNVLLKSLKYIKMSLTRFQSRLQNTQCNETKSYRVARWAASFPLGGMPTCLLRTPMASRCILLPTQSNYMVEVGSYQPTNQRVYIFSFQWNDN